MALVIPEVLDASCATRQALERLAAQWRILLIYSLLDGPQPLTALRRRLPGSTEPALSEALRAMAADGLIVQESDADTAVYSLTALGKSLETPLAAICTWAVEHADDAASE